MKLFGTLFLVSLRGLASPRRLLAALCLALSPVALALIWKAAPGRSGFSPELTYNVMCGMLLFGFVLVMSSAVFGSGAVSTEIEQRTIVYLLTRPVRRWIILAGKWLAALLFIVVLCEVSVTLLALAVWGGAGLRQPTVLRDLAILPVGALAYASLFVLVATLLNRPLMYSLGFAFGWEAWVPNMPGNFAKLSLMSWLRALSPHALPEEDTMRLADMLSSMSPTQIAAADAWWVLGITTAVCVLMAVVVFSRAQYAPREDAE